MDSPGPLRTLLARANAGEYRGKREWFYPLKDKLLRAFGAFDGYDKQVLTYECWRCGGSGDALDSNLDECNRCGGSGVWARCTFFLERYRLDGRIFHIPTDMRNLPEGVEPVNVFDRKLIHRVHNPEEAHRAAVTLLAYSHLLWKLPEERPRTCGDCRYLGLPEPEMAMPRTYCLTFKLFGPRDPEHRVCENFRAKEKTT